MIDMLLLNGALMAPEIVGAATHGAASLAVSTGTHVGKGIASGLAEGLGDASENVTGLAQAAGEGLAGGLVKGAMSELAEAGSALAREFFGEARGR